MTSATKDTIEAGHINAVEQVRLRILHALEIFPFISSSMLHQAIGTATLGTLWKPVLADLVADGLVREHSLSAKGATGRQQSYTIYHLAKNEYTFGA